MWDGFFCVIMLAFLAQFVTPYLLLLGASNVQIGLLTGLPNLIGGFVQILSIYLMAILTSRRFICQIGTAGQSFCLLILIFAGYLSGTKGVYLAILAFTLFGVFGNLVVSPWGSWMADLIPSSRRARFFGRRNQLLGTIQMLLTFLAGWFLSRFKSHRLWGFTILFIAAAIARLLSTACLGKQMEPTFAKEKHSPKDSLWNFIKNARKDNYAQFVMFIGVLHITSQICSPFFTVFMLKEQHFSYLTYTFVDLGAMISRLAMLPFWGLMVDMLGAIKVIRFCAWGVPIMPLIWVLTSNPTHLFITNIFAGALWSGLEIAIWNFVYDACGKEKQIRGMAYLGLVGGLTIFAGNIIGGKIISILPAINGSQIRSVFLLSGILRFIPAFLFLRLKEVKKIRYMSSWRIFFQIPGVRPVTDLTKSVIGIIRRFYV